MKTHYETTKWVVTYLSHVKFMRTLIYLNSQETYFKDTSRYRQNEQTMKIFVKILQGWKFNFIEICILYYRETAILIENEQRIAIVNSHKYKCNFFT